MQGEVETKRAARRNAILIMLLISMVLMFLLSIALGSVNIKLADVISILLGKDSASDAHQSIISKIRLPRAIASMAGGVCLALSGLLLQIFFSNPIVEPYVLGISSGATMFVSIVFLGGYTFGFSATNPMFMFIGALVGSMIVMLAVVLAARKVQNIVTLLVIGMMTGYLCSSIRSIMSSFASLESLGSLTLWTMGSFAGFTWQKVKILAIITSIFAVLAFLLSKPLNAMLLGEGYAQSMGVGIRRFRIAVIIIASVLTAVLTAFAGPISFVGLATPHMLRMGLKTADNRVLVPACVLGGALTTNLCDLLARTLLAPVELPIGAITSLFGAPLVIYMLLRRDSGL
ncbi:MAG: iron ABC transporter permease [Oscillospiraceae bacterium]|nr:iron ABC transporter permease [Oscillospiraceae bacterium]